MTGAPGTDDAMRALREQGFARLGRVLAPELVVEVRSELQAYAGEHAVSGPYGLIGHNPWRHVESARRIIAQVLAPLALELLAEDAVVLFQDVLISKPPGANQAVKWHQDYSYWPLDAAAGLTMWIALDDVSVESGCLRYVPGTHALGERHPADFFEGVPQPARPHLARLEAEAHESEAVAVPVLAGEALAHHPLVWHMSRVNSTLGPRRAWSLTWITPAVRWAPDHASHPFNHYLEPREGAPVQGEWFMRFQRGATSPADRPCPGPGPRLR